MPSDPLEGIDPAARSEESARLENALESARNLALDRDFDKAEREIEPWLHRPESDPDDDIRQAGDAKAMAAAIMRARAIHDPAGFVGLKPVSAFAGERPPPVLWMDARRGGGTILRVGDVALLSGAGGSGKSFVSLALAVAAARDGDGKHGDACGLGVRKGPAVVLSYEDDPNTVAWRCGLIASTMADAIGSAPKNVLLIPDPEPLMVADHDNPGKVQKAELWARLWEAVRSMSPSLVIVDPASAALAGVNQNDGGTVRRFLRALAQEGKKGDFGVLVVAHSTKAARYGQSDPGPGAVAGSGQWWDAARGILFMRGQGPKRAVIKCVKSNHGPVGWAVELDADMRSRESKPDRFAGWLRRKRYSPKDWADREKEREPEKAKPEKAKAKKAKAKEAEVKEAKADKAVKTVGGRWGGIARCKSKTKGKGKRGPAPPNVDDV